MKVKWYVFSVICLLITPAASDPVLQYQKGDVMYILSDTGLVLRTAPDVASSRINVLEYGTVVRIIDESPGKNSCVVGNYRGYWVKAAAGGKEGYLFDGFMSRYAAPVTCSTCSFTTIVENYTDSKFIRKSAPEVRKDQCYQYQNKVYTNGCVLEKKEGLPGLPHFSLSLKLKSTRLSEAFLLVRLMGVELMKGQIFPVKGRTGERKMKGLVYKETVEVTKHNDEIHRILIAALSKEEDGMGEGREQESIEFLKTADGTIVKYTASGN